MCLHSLYTSFLDVPLVICKYGCTRKNWLKKPYISLTILHHNTIYMKNTMNHNWEWQSIYSNLPSTTQKKKLCLNIQSTEKLKSEIVILQSKQPTIWYHIIVHSLLPPHAHTTLSFVCWLPNPSWETLTALQPALWLVEDENTSPRL